MLHHAKTAIAGAQILFVAFGAMVLVPILTGLNPALALLGAGIGTLLFQLLTKRKVPIFLGSSFAFIAPIIAAKQQWGLGATMFGLFAAGFMYFIFAILVRWRGLEAVHKMLPPVVIGSVIIVIGLSVAAAASSMAVGNVGQKRVLLRLVETVDFIHKHNAAFTLLLGDLGLGNGFADFFHARQNG